MRTQVTFDCADPHAQHAQATFWARVFGTAVEDHSALVDQLVADGRMPAADSIVVDGRSAFRYVAACSDPTGAEPRLFFQRVPDTTTTGLPRTPKRPPSRDDLGASVVEGA